MEILSKVVRDLIATRNQELSKGLTKLHDGQEKQIVLKPADGRGPEIVIRSAMPPAKPDSK